MGKMCELNEKIYIHAAKQLTFLITDDTQEPSVASKSALSWGDEYVIGFLFI